MIYFCKNTKNIIFETLFSCRNNSEIIPKQIRINKNILEYLLKVSSGR